MARHTPIKHILVLSDKKSQLIIMVFNDKQKPLSNSPVFTALLFNLPPFAKVVNAKHNKHKPDIKLNINIFWVFSLNSKSAVADLLILITNT